MRARPARRHGSPARPDRPSQVAFGGSVSTNVTPRRTHASRDASSAVPCASTWDVTGHRTAGEVHLAGVRLFEGLAVTITADPHHQIGARDPAGHVTAHHERQAAEHPALGHVHPLGEHLADTFGQCLVIGHKLILYITARVDSVRAGGAATHHRHTAVGPGAAHAAGSRWGRILEPGHPHGRRVNDRWTPALRRVGWRRAPVRRRRRSPSRRRRRRPRRRPRARRPRWLRGGRRTRRRGHRRRRCAG